MMQVATIPKSCRSPSASRRRRRAAKWPNHPNASNAIAVAAASVSGKSKAVIHQT
jgi:hypothetical protein